MDVSSIPILSIITFLPLVGAIVVAVLPSGWARPAALAFALVTWVVSLFLLLGYLPTREGDAAFQFVETVDWIPLFGIQYQLGADGLGVALVPDLILNAAKHEDVVTLSLTPPSRRQILAVTTSDLQRVPAVSAALRALGEAAGAPVVERDPALAPA